MIMDDKTNIPLKNKLFKNKLVILLISIIIILLVLFLVSWRLRSVSKIVSCENSYEFINSELGCQISEQDELEKLDILEKEIDNFVDAAVVANKVTVVSVFFRDLKSKRWFGVNENENYSPASLLKLPLMMAYLKFAEIKPEIFSERILYQENEVESRAQNIKPTRSIEKGKSYTVEELINYMIVYSDNKATSLLYKNIDPVIFNRVYIDLGVYFPISGGLEQNFLSVKTYAAIFRTLYNASYLNRSMSEKALKLLSKVEFKEGLVAGVPSSIKVVHKFGEMSVVDPTNKNVLGLALHDCGIIYHPDFPYILCVLTRGENFENLQNVIKGISRIVYEEIKNK